MRRFDKDKNMDKVNMLAEQRYINYKGLLKEDQSTTFKNSREVDNQIKSKGDELLMKHPIMVYSEWDLNNKEIQAAQERLENPIKFESIDTVNSINNYQDELLQQGKSGPTVYFTPSIGVPKKVEVTLKGVESNLLSKRFDLITKDGFHSIITIMKNTIDASNDFTEVEKQKLLQDIIRHFKVFILNK